MESRKEGTEAGAVIPAPHPCGISPPRGLRVPIKGLAVHPSWGPARHSETSLPPGGRTTECWKYRAWLARVPSSLLPPPVLRCHLQNDSIPTDSGQVPSGPPHSALPTTHPRLHPPTHPPDTNPSGRPPAALAPGPLHTLLPVRNTLPPTPTCPTLPLRHRVLWEAVLGAPNGRGAVCVCRLHSVPKHRLLRLPG